jgi:hypothetical protein
MIQSSVNIYKNFLSSEDCNLFKLQMEQKLAGHPNPVGEDRVIDITNSATVLINKVQAFIYQHCQLSLVCNQAQIQVWPVGSSSELHRHDSRGRENTTMNSMLYLNEDFEGGEFYTEDLFTYKPEQGTLTLFNGRTLYHGVLPVKISNRYTIIFWWQ